jgi:hypothetical protein
MDKALREDEQKSLENKSDEEIVRLCLAYARQNSYIVGGLLLEAARRISKNENPG